MCLRGGVHLVAACLLQAAHQLLHCGVDSIVLLEVVLHSGEVCAPLSSFQKILNHKDT